LSKLHPSISQADPEFRAAAETELAVILESPQFQASRRSTQFLRFLVESFLNGRIDLLKERTLGAEVLGRRASYDTGSDASVRVRANDVRRRLASYYAANPNRAGWRIELPLGRYVPKLVRFSDEPASITFVPGRESTLVMRAKDITSLEDAARLLTRLALTQAG
jgi:hypothetical protein